MPSLYPPAKGIRELRYFSLRIFDAAQNMKNAVARAQFRQLCSLGLDPPAVVPALLSITHHLVSSEYSVFRWPSSPNAESCSGRISVLVAQPPSLFGYRYIGQLDNGLVVESLRRTIVLTDLVCLRGRLAPAPRYRSVGWPGSRHRTITCSVKSPSGRHLGQLMLVREAGAREFTLEDYASLAQMQPHFANALEPRRLCQDGFAAVGTPGVITLNPDGAISHSNLRARALLPLAGETLNSFPAPGRFSMRLKEACHHLISVPSSTTGAHWFEHRTHWGLFHAHCERLDPRTSFGCGVVVATIEHHEPVALVRMRAMQAAKLSPRQMQVCLLLCKQSSLEEVSCETGVSITTVKDYVQTIYARFGVHTRDGLRARLLHRVVPATPAPARAPAPIVVGTPKLDSIVAFARIKADEARDAMRDAEPEAWRTPDEILPRGRDPAAPG